MGYFKRFLHILDKARFIIIGIFIIVFLIIFTISNKDAIISKNSLFTTDESELSVFSVNEYREKARKDHCMTNIRIIESAIDMYLIDKNISEDNVKKDQKISEMDFLKEYFYNKKLPECSLGGKYIIKDKKVKCTIHGSFEN